MSMSNVLHPRPRSSRVDFEFDDLATLLTLPCSISQQEIHHYLYIHPTAALPSTPLLSLKVEPRDNPPHMSQQTKINVITMRQERVLACTEINSD